jgi:hypothetical protein
LITIVFPHLHRKPHLIITILIQQVEEFPGIRSVQLLRGEVRLNLEGDPYLPFLAGQDSGWC